ncbi:MAG: hypothetical protein IJO34_03915 [Akkermansia sp.]|nr:hypothetical protein [Akkermansia sp.]
MNQYIKRKWETAFLLNGRAGIMMLLLVVSATINYFCNLYSPQYDEVMWDGVDALVFCMDGRAWVHGYVPYVDFEDCKGPLLFFIHAFGYLVSRCFFGGCGRDMMFFINIACTFVTLCFLYKTARIFCAEKWKAVVACTIPLFSLFSPSLGVWGGQPEVYTVVFLSAFLFYFTESLYGEHGKPGVLSVALVSGIAVGGTLLVKYTNTVPILFGTFLVLLFAVDRKNILRFLVWFMVGLGAMTLPFVIYMLITSSFDDFLRVYLFGNFLSYFGAHKAGHSNGSLIQLCINFLSYCIRDPRTFYSFVALPFMLLVPFVGKAKRLGRFNVPCWGILLAFAFSICASCWGMYEYYQLYASVLLVFPAVFLLVNCRFAPSGFVVVIVVAFICSFIIRQNGMWYEKNMAQAEKKEFISLDAIVCEKKEPKILNFLGLGTSMGMKACSLPACPQWIALNGYPYDYLQIHMQAVRDRKADFIFVTGDKHQEEFSAEFRKNGYSYVGSGRATTKIDYHVWKKL